MQLLNAKEKEEIRNLVRVFVAVGLSFVKDNHTQSEDPVFKLRPYD
jgi:hypothetical protein